MELLNAITINTDASFNTKLKVGGYAFYIRVGDSIIKSAGSFKTNPANPIEAEMMCIGNAVYTLSSLKELPPAKLIVINSDCLTAFELIKLKSKNPTGKSVALLIKTLKEKASYQGLIPPRIQFRHVKAHTGAQDARSWVNRWCDREAKIKMREESKKILEKEA